MSGNLTEIFKIMEFQVMVDILSMFLFELEIYCQGRFKKQSLVTFFFLFVVIE